MELENIAERFSITDRSTIVGFDRQKYEYFNKSLTETTEGPTSSASDTLSDWEWRCEFTSCDKSFQRCQQHKYVFIISLGLNFLAYWMNRAATKCIM
jgi:hypothetical protein